MIFFSSGGSELYLALFMVITQVAVYSAPTAVSNSL